MHVLWNKTDKESDLLSALLTDNTTIPKTLVTFLYNPIVLYGDVIIICALFCSLMERVISGIQSSDLSDPIKRVAAERLKLKSHGVNHNYSLYRDILFLAFVAIGRENIDQSMSFSSALYSSSTVGRLEIRVDLITK